MALNPSILAEFPYELDTFQKESCLAIERGDHVLVTAHTSAGKSTVALYAIAKAILDNKRAIYTAPVKTLSNQKYADLKAKYCGKKAVDDEGASPVRISTSVGIQTGDVKVNPDAQILVMTTEILRNMLSKGGGGGAGGTGAFDDLAFVILDEAHMLNDEARGGVWEEVIMRLPSHVQMILLSATMANPEEVAAWIERIKPPKKVPIVSTLRRPVPLQFHVFVPLPSTFSEDLPWEDAVKGGHLTTILASEHGAVDVTAYLTMQKRYTAVISREWESTKRRDLTTGRKGVAEANASRAADKTRAPFQMISMLTPFVNFLHINRQLPAIFFTLSRKKCDLYAGRLKTSLIDHLERAEIERIFEYHIRKLPDHEQYAQVVNVRQWLLNGVGVHHSGMLPLLKEIVEIVFTKGLVKVMFATETLAIGVNTPTRVVCFLDVTKHNGKEVRPLLVEEFKQMAGRAGRRGLDTVGHVVYFPVYDPVTSTELTAMMKGAIKRISSKFNVSTHYVLRSINARGSPLIPVDGGYGGARSQEAEPPSDPGYPPVTLSEIIGVTRNSLMQSEHVAHGQGCAVQLEAAVSQLAALEDRIKAIDPRLRVLLEAEAAAASSIMVNKKERARAMKAIAADIDALTKAERVDFDKLRGSLRDKAGLEKTVASLTKEKAELPTLLEEDIRNALAFLEAQGYVRVSDSGDGHEGGNNNKYALTVKGVFACGISQCNEVFLTEPMFGGGAPMKTDPATFAAWLAVFIDDSEEALEIPAYTDLGKSTVEAGEVLYDELQKSGVYTGPFVLSLRYVDPVWEWCNGAHLQTICQAYNLFEGNVVRSLLRLVSLMDEVRAAAEAVQKIEWTMLIDEAKALVVRDVLRTESLYLT